MTEGAHRVPADTSDVGSDETLTRTVGRRTFLKVLGSSAPAAAITACAPIPAEQLIPYVVPPEDVVPGVATWYATVCGECPAGCGMVVRTREGRAVKVEGNPEHPVNRGSLCIRGQASLQGLYDPDRFSGPQRRRATNAAAGQSVLEPIGWEAAQRLFVDRLRDAQAGRIAIVTPLLTGTLDRLVERWAGGVGARRIRYEPFAHEALRAAGLAAFGRPVVPHYDFARPDLIVSFGADFLETWLSPVAYGRDFADGRRRDGSGRTRLVQLEPRLSLTGAQADEWLAIEPGTEGLVAAAMVHVIVSEQRTLLPDPDAGAAGRIFELVRDHAPERVAAQTGVPAETIRTLARRFADPAAGGGRTLAVGGGVSASGAGATAALTAMHLLNHVAGNTGATVTFEQEDGGSADGGPPGPAGWDGAGSHREMLELAAAMEAGEIDLLLLHGVNPVHAMPGGAGFAAAAAKVPTVVSTASCPDETSSLADLVLPAHTPLEAWGDAEPRRGVRGLQQPAMRPLLDTRHLGDLLLDSGRALGGDAAETLPAEGDFLDVLRAEWRDALARRAGGGDTPAADFDVFWDDARRRGGAWQPAAPAAVALNPAVLETPLDLDPEVDGNRALALVVYPSPHLYDGRGANRAWLQEVPDALMQTAWSSWVEAAPETAAVIGAEEGQLVTIESDHGAADATLLLNPRLRPGVVAVPLGQGHTQYGRYASGRGINAAALIDPAPEAASGGPRWLGTRVDVTPRAVRRALPRLQTTFDQDSRGIAQAVTQEELAAGLPDVQEAPFSLYPDHPHPVHRWGMAIDLDSCTGCNACVAACYAENNVPVLGADRMRRGRTMSWIRIERFVEEEDAGAGNRFLPMLCQHCDHAPCESVCPTYATYHTDEGLNAQVYNRCVGTRYCSNNCPYKVRRFNWSQPEVPEPLTLQLNPDVTTRSAGVMEKCTFCVQRINEGQDRARDENRPPADGDITPACAQTCPAQAIVFGDLNDPDSRVSKAAADPRAYHVLETLNTRPAVTYLKKVRDA